MNYSEYAMQQVRERRLLINEVDSWIYDEIAPYLGQRILEIGCGLGNFTQMLTDREHWDMILVLKMDRIHRNSRNFMEMMDNLSSWGKEFSSMEESLDTSTAMGRFVVDIIQRIAQLESEQIGERVYLAMKQKAKTVGGPLGGNIPYGYDYYNGTLKLNEKEICKGCLSRIKSLNKNQNEI